MRSQSRRFPDAKATGVDGVTGDHPGVRPRPARPDKAVTMTTNKARHRGEAELLDDDQLRTALTDLATLPDRQGLPQWEAIGRQLIALAKLESLEWHWHAEEFQGALIDDAIKRLLRYPQKVIAADHPWWLLITRARRAAKGAVAAESRVGITDRDPVTHRLRIAELGALKVSSYDVLVEREDAPDGQWSA